MKTLLTLFVLLFSSSVAAKNTLVGVSYLCAFEEHNKYNIIGFGFLENNRIRGVQGDINAGITLNSGDIPKRIIEYETSPISIKIFVKNESEFIKINRKSLELSFHKNSKDLGSISGSNCEIYKIGNIETNFEKLKEKLITELSKDNKL